MKDPLIGLLRWANRTKNGGAYLLAIFVLVQAIGLLLISLQTFVAGSMVWLLGTGLIFWVYAQAPTKGSQ